MINKLRFKMTKRNKRYGSRKKKKKCNDSESDSDSDSESPEIRVVKNHIYFWCDVTKKTALELSIKLTEVYCSFNQLAMSGDDIIPLYLHINSDGGDADAAIGVLDSLESLIAQGAKVVTIVEGSASSAATIISVGGSERRIRPNAYMRVHQFTTGIMGKKSVIDDEHGNLEKFEEVLCRIYTKHTHMNKTQLKKLLGRELDLNPEECIEKGLIDCIQE